MTYWIIANLMINCLITGYYYERKTFWHGSVIIKALWLIAGIVLALEYIVGYWLIVVIGVILMFIDKWVNVRPWITYLSGGYDNLGKKELRFLYNLKEAWEKQDRIKLWQRHSIFLVNKVIKKNNYIHTPENTETE